MTTSIVRIATVSGSNSLHRTIESNGDVLLPPYILCTCARWRGAERDRWEEVTRDAGRPATVRFADNTEDPGPSRQREYSYGGRVVKEVSSRR